MTIHDELAAIRERHVDHSTVHQGKPGNLVAPYCCGLAQMGATGPGVCNACAQPFPCDASRQANALQAVVDLHEPMTVAMSDACSQCTGTEGLVSWPCPTIRAIEEAMEAGA